MLLEVIISLALGVIFGIITGLLPGIHINLVSVWLVAVAPVLLNFFPPIAVACLVVAMGITQTFFDPIPSVFLGAPSSDTALIVLPGHRLLAQGKGYDAVCLIGTGAFASLIAMVVVSPLIYIIIKYGYPFVEFAMGPLLLAFIAFFLLRSSTWQVRLWSLIVFALTGALGLTVLNSPIFQEPMFPMLTGLFGMSMLIKSLGTNSELPEQIPNPETKIQLSAKPIIGACVGGLITGVFPGISAAHATVIGRTFLGKLKTAEYLMLNGGVNLVNFFVSLFALHLIGKPRNGAVLALQNFMPKLGFLELLLLISVSLLIGGLAFLLSLFIARQYCRVFNRINYRLLSLSVIVLLLLFTLKISGFLGLAVLITATALGFIPLTAGVSMSNCMGCILVPVTLYFIF